MNTSTTLALLAVASLLSACGADLEPTGETEGASTTAESTEGAATPVSETTEQTTEPALPSRARLDAAVAASGAGDRPCGAYVNTDTIWQKLVFGDGSRAWVVLAADDEPRPHELRAWALTSEGQIAVRNDRGFFLFERVDEQTLRGLDSWTEGGTWVRAATPESGCTPIAEGEREELSHELCELDGYLLRMGGDLDGALALHERCCDGGAAASCDRSGQILEIARRDFEGAERRFRASCDGGHGRGCFDLAQLLRRQGRMDEVLALYERGCEAGSVDACSEKVLLEMDQEEL